MANEKKYKADNEAIYTGSCRGEREGEYKQHEAYITRLHAETGEQIRADLYFFMTDTATRFINLNRKPKTKKELERRRVALCNVPMAADPNNPGPHTFFFKKDKANEEQSGPHEKSDNSDISTPRALQLLQRSRGAPAGKGHNHRQ